jgi:hypothetical protein
LVALVALLFLEGRRRRVLGGMMWSLVGWFDRMRLGAGILQQDRSRAGR